MTDKRDEEILGFIRETAKRADNDLSPATRAQMRAFVESEIEKRQRRWWSWSYLLVPLAAGVLAFGLVRFINSSPTSNEFTAPKTAHSRQLVPGTQRLAAGDTIVASGFAVRSKAPAEIVARRLSELATDSIETWDLELTEGEFTFDFGATAPPSALIVRTPHTTIHGALGAFRVVSGARQTRVDVERGEVRIEDQAGRQSVGAGESVTRPAPRAEAKSDGPRQAAPAKRRLRSSELLAKATKKVRTGRGRFARRQAGGTGRTGRPGGTAAHRKIKKEAEAKAAPERVSDRAPPAARPASSEEPKPAEVARSQTPPIEPAPATPQPAAVPDVPVEAEPDPVAPKTPSVSERLRQADALRRRRAFRKAATAYAELSEDPAADRFAEEAAFRHAQMLIALRDHTEALAVIHRSSARHPRGRLVLERIGLEARAYLADGDEDRAVELLVKAPKSKALELQLACVIVGEAVLEDSPRDALRLAKLVTENASAARLLRRALLLAKRASELLGDVAATRSFDRRLEETKKTGERPPRNR